MKTTVGELDMPTKTVQWSSRFTFMMAAIGASVGLGNLWRFSAELGTNGGGAFLLVYIACILFVGVPVLMSEYLIGRAGRASSAIESANDLAQRSGVSKLWSSGAWIGMIASLLIVSFYCVVAAWVLRYLGLFLTDAFSGLSGQEIAEAFPKMLGAPGEVLPYFLVFAAITIALVARGINKGIEVAARFLMPVFFALLLGLALYAIVSGFSSGGTMQAVSFMFTPVFSKITPEVASSALGQACFSIGIGLAAMIAYGSYLSDEIDIPWAAVTVSLVDTLVALIAGLAIFPIVFLNDLDFSAGAGLFFVTLPTALSEFWIVGAAFFFLAFFAAITSSVSLLEPAAAYLAENFNLPKSIGAMLAGSVFIGIGLGCLYSPQLFDFIDTGLTGPVMMPLSALLVTLFTGWRLDRAIISEQISSDDKRLGKALLFLVRWVAPVFMSFILIGGIYSKWIAPLL